MLDSHPYLILDTYGKLYGQGPDLYLLDKVCQCALFHKYYIVEPETHMIIRDYRMQANHAFKSAIELVTSNDWPIVVDREKFINDEIEKFIKIFQTLSKIKVYYVEPNLEKDIPEQTTIEIYNCNLSDAEKEKYKDNILWFGNLPDRRMPNYKVAWEVFSNTSVDGVAFIAWLEGEKND